LLFLFRSVRFCLRQAEWHVTSGGNAPDSEKRERRRQPEQAMKPI
jgi:hypothetical protein